MKRILFGIALVSLGAVALSVHPKVTTTENGTSVTIVQNTANACPACDAARNGCVNNCPPGGGYYACVYNCDQAWISCNDNCGGGGGGDPCSGGGCSSQCPQNCD